MSLRVAGADVERLLVVGFGTTGRAVCRFAVDRGASPCVSEQRTLTGEERAWLSAYGIGFEEGGHSERMLDRMEMVVLSPGVPMTSPLVQGARRRGISVYSELDLAVLSDEMPPIVAVTGTNGKSSTVALIGELLRRWGLEAPVVGNIGTPLIDAAGRASRCDALVVEASSYQLEQSVAFRPYVGVLLNLEPDHLERHGTMDAYAEAKGRLFRLQTARDTAILPGRLADRFLQGDARRVHYDERKALLEGSERLSGHQRDNLCAALCACEALLPEGDHAALPIDRILATAALPHRMVAVGAVERVRIVDDSKATNAAATVAALAATRGPIVLLLGGRSKGAGYEALRDALSASEIRRIILFGEAAGQLSDLLDRFPIEPVPDVEAAVRAGLEAARPGDTLLFSPACSSFDQFRDFAERGEVFARAVRARPGFAPA